VICWGGETLLLGVEGIPSFGVSAGLLASFARGFDEPSA
jgi:hypothetical protein